MTGYRRSGLTGRRPKLTLLAFLSPEKRTLADFAEESEQSLKFAIRDVSSPHQRTVCDQNPRNPIRSSTGIVTPRRSFAGSIRRTHRVLIGNRHELPQRPYTATAPSSVSEKLTWPTVA